MNRKLHEHFKLTNPIGENDDLSQTIFTDRRDIKNDKRFAVGVPVYIGGAGAGSSKT